jgi:hypothetical protein
MKSKRPDPWYVCDPFDACTTSGRPVNACHSFVLGDEAPLGLILCANKSMEQVDLLQLDKSGIRVAA